MPYNSPYPANPLLVKQAPDHRALMKSTGLVIESQALALPAISQEYFEPGINHRLIRRTRPKTNYTLPSDPKSFPLGVVPVNLEAGVAGEEPPIIKTSVAQPADLLQVFARINAEEMAQQKIPYAGIDVGQSVANDYLANLREKSRGEMMDKLMNEGNKEEDIKEAMKLNKLRSLQKKLNGGM
jgi:hypothetical protein